MSKTFIRPAISSAIYIDSVTNEPTLNVAIDESKYIKVRSSKDIPGSYVQYVLTSSTLEEWVFYTNKTDLVETGRVKITYNDSTRTVVDNIEYLIILPDYIDFPVDNTSSGETAISIREKLESLTGDARLDASSIKNIPSGGSMTGEQILAAIGDNNITEQYLSQQIIDKINYSI